MEALQTLLVGKTALIIAHRLSTVRFASRIIVLHKGGIIEGGSFTELLWKQGMFTSLYHAQFEGRTRIRDGAA